MTFSCRATILGFAVLTVWSSSEATDRFVSPFGSHVPPFTDWSTAATNIQAAVDAAAAGDQIWVTNGVYSTGGALAPQGLLTNRVAVTKALTVQSVNGPEVTLIEGAATPGTTNGTQSIRCAWLGDGAVLSGFSLTKGTTMQSSGPNGSGGGVYCNSKAAILTNCIISGNRAYLDGGGVFQGTVQSCVISNNASAAGGGAYNAWLSDSDVRANRATSGGGLYCASNGITIVSSIVAGNSAVNMGAGAYQGTLTGCRLENNVMGLTGQGGGAYSAVLQNCLIRSNTAGLGGGAYNSVVSGSALVGNFGLGFYASSASAGQLRNCTVTGNLFGGTEGGSAVNSIIYYNGETQSVNYVQTTLTNCCTEPVAPRDSGRNLPGEPMLMSDGIHLRIGSPCIGAANKAFVSGVDLDGQPWANPPSIGCDEWNPQPLLVSQPRVLPGSLPGQAQLVLEVAGQQPFCWWTKNGVPLEDNGHLSATHSNVLSISQFNVSDEGGYQVIGSNSFGMITSALVTVSVACVDPAGSSPNAPYGSWATAAATIQDAVDASPVGTVILVTNGTFNAGGHLVSGDGTTNRVVLDKPLSVLSVNGPEQTVIDGAWDEANTNGPGSIRCLWITDGAVLGGFTLRNGSAALDGGGVWSGGSGLQPSLVGCVITNCSAGRYGGGAYQGRLVQTIVVGNMAGGGGGLVYGFAEACEFTANTAPSGGAVSQSHLVRCEVTLNSSGQGAGAVNGGGTFSSLIASNNAVGVRGGFVRNCRILGNSGGGAISTFMQGSLIRGNPTWGSVGCTNLNCTFIQNATSVSGAYSTNCLFYLNGPGTGTRVNCLLQPGDTLSTLDPGPWWLFPNLLSDGFHIAADSPAIARGFDTGIPGEDLDGHPRAHPPSIGCVEWSPQPLLISQPRVMPGSAPGQGQLVLEVAGQSPYCYWTKDGVPLDDNGHLSAAHSNIVSVAQFNISDAGAYQVIASNSFGMITSAVVTVNVACVDPASPNPNAPYGSWASAATTIQDAVDASRVGTVVLVTNGTYSSGGRLMSGDNTTNRVVLDKALTLLSVNGPQQTVIEGAWDTANTNGPGSIRCAWIAEGAVLGGFTLRNGSAAINGGGAWSAGAGLQQSVVNCVITNCSAGSYGGGAFQGRLADCVLEGNTAQTGGGAAMAFVDHSLVRGNSAVNAAGVAGGIVRRSQILANIAHEGGGFDGPGVLEGCLVAFNQAVYGAGIYNAQVHQCTVVSNVSLGNIVAGVDFSSVWNSIVYFNVAPVSPIYGLEFSNLGGSGSYYNVCYTPYRNFISGITNNPELIDLAHCAATSPCRNAGMDLGITGFSDIDGESWNAPPTIGCAEIVDTQLAGPLSIQLSAWPEVAAGGVMPVKAFLSGRASRLDWDFGDGTVVTNSGFSTAYTWTNPGTYAIRATAFNLDYPTGVVASASVRVLPVITPSLTGATISNGVLSFQFVAQPGLTYLVQSSANLSFPIDWQPVQSLSSTSAVLSVATATVPDPSRFYRLRIQ